MTVSNEPDDSVESVLQAALLDLTAKQFDQLIVFLIEEVVQNADVSFSPKVETRGIDLVVTHLSPFLDVKYGIAIDQRDSKKDVPVEDVDSFAESLSDESLSTGTVLTNGQFSEEAAALAEDRGVSLVDGEELSSLLIQHELGFTVTGERVELDEAFWDLFRGQTRSETVPSLEVPQADSIDRLNQVLASVDAGNHHKIEIADAVESDSGDSFDPRQADYYGTAGWLLEFLHKDRNQTDGGGRGRWSLTRRGQSYISYVESGQSERAQILLQEQIRDMEIVRRILEQLADSGVLRREELAEIVGEETQLGGTTVGRRTLTIVRWLENLPEIRTSGSGSSQRIEYVSDSRPAGDTTAQSLDDSDRESIETGTDANVPDEDSIMDEILASFDASMSSN